MNRFPYADTNGFYDEADRQDQLAMARKLLDVEGGVIYDDSRAYIVTTNDKEMISEGVRISGDTLSADEVTDILTYMTANDRDFRFPITRNILLSWANDFADEN